jgi:anaerobic selenocysteine-containing dehydrogenase
MYLTTDMDEASSGTEPGTDVVREQRSYCRFCISLCGIIVSTQGDRVVNVAGDPDHPVSQGYTCPKGRALGQMHHHPERLDHPELRTGQDLAPASWDACLEDLGGAVERVVRESGPDAVGMYLATASAFDANGRRLARKFLRSIGSRSLYTSTTVDTPCKPLVSELMAGHPGLVPAVDHEGATLTILIGCNPVISHGHLNAFPSPRVRLRALAEQGELWVIDPRRTETARLASRHLAPRAGTDYVLIGHLVRELLRDGADHEYLEAHATGVEELGRAVEPFDLDTTVERTGLAPEEVTDLVAAVRRHRRLAGQTGTGVTMSAGANATEWLLWALHVVTGSYDRPGGMWFHPGYLHNLDQRSFQATDAQPDPGPPSRPELPRRWGEYPCAGMADEIEAGNLRALFVVGGNPVTSLPETARLREAFAKLDVLAVFDVVRTDTTALATHLLPCAGQLERADLPHNTDQFQAAVATQYTPAMVPPGGERKPMWWPFAKLGERFDMELLPEGLTAETCTDDDLLAELAARSKASFDDLREAPTGVVSKEAVFGWVTEQVLPEGRWRLAPAPLVEQLATLADPPPLVLIPRRQLRHLNSQLRQPDDTEGKADYPDVLLHPADAEAAGVEQGQRVRVTSAHGEVTGTARLDVDIRRGAVSVPHGFGNPNVNYLTSAREGVDPLTGMVLQSGVPLTVTPA